MIRRNCATRWRRAARRRGLVFELRGRDTHCMISTTERLSRDSRFGQRNARALAVEIVNGCVDGLVECGDIGEGLMGEVMGLEVAPDHLDVIEFWRVFWQPLDREPV